MHDNFVIPRFPAFSAEEKFRYLLALWFHDIIYDGKSTENEELSAATFKEFAKECELDD